jgi:hypothetical protein
MEIPVRRVMVNVVIDKKSDGVSVISYIQFPLATFVVTESMNVESLPSAIFATVVVFWLLAETNVVGTSVGSVANQSHLPLHK